MLPARHSGRNCAMLLAKVWYFLSTGGQAFVLPYFNVYFDQLGFSKDAIGVLSALRPWLSAPCAVLLCALADKLSCHTALLVATFAASLLLRCMLLLVPPHFLTVAALVLLSDCIGAPVGAIVDATVVGACKSDGDYGKHRMWASSAWGGLSIIAGSLVAQRGLGAGFLMYLLMSLPCIFIAFRIRKRAEAEKAAAATEAAAAPAASAQFCSPSPLDKQQKQLQIPTDTSRMQPTAAAAAAEPAGELTEDLMARLLPGTPNSLSSYGGSCATSNCGGSRPCSPDIGMPARCTSPFSRFAATSFGRSIEAVADEAEYGAGGLQDGGVGSPRVQHAGAAAAAGGSETIKAWYAEEEEEQDVAQQQHQQQQQELQEAAAVAPAAAAAELLAGGSIAQQPAGDAAAAAGLAAAVAGVGTEDEAAAGAAVVVSTAAAAVTKESAKLELGTSQQLQSSYSLLEWQADKASAKAAATPTAAKATVHAAEEDEGAPLLALNDKQPLPVKAAAEGTGAGLAEGCTAVEGAMVSHDAADGDVTIRTLLASPAVLVFMWRALIIGLGLGTIGNFLFLHVEELGGTASLMGLMLFFNCVTEVPAFHFQSVILDRLPVPLVYNGSMLLLALRLAGYGFLPLLHSPWPVLVLELLHGCTFASSWGAGIVHCKRLAPPHLNASMQGLFSSLYGGVGSGLGALLGGVLMQQLGGQALFFICSLVVLAGWLVGYVVELLLVRRDQHVKA